MLFANREVRLDNNCSTGLAYDKVFGIFKRFKRVRFSKDAKPRAQFLSIRIDQGRQITFSFSFLIFFNVQTCQLVVKIQTFYIKARVKTASNPFRNDRGQDRKFPPVCRTNQIAAFSSSSLLARRERKKMQ